MARPRSRVLLSIFGFAVIAASLCTNAFSQDPRYRTEDRSGPLHGNHAIKPFKIIGNVYYVGMSDQTSYLITTPQGNFLIDQTWESSVPQIRKSIEQLGFKMKDIKYLLNAHAHSDHVDGLAAMKEITGGKVLVMDGDVDAIKNGGEPGSPAGQFHPARIDQTLHDGDQVKLGSTTMVAHLTPGHTAGCTSWSTVAEENGKKYNVMFICSMGVNPGTILVNNPTYPNIAKDYEKGFAALKALPCDIFLSSHGNQFGLADRIERMQQNPSVNPFIDPQGYKDYIVKYETAFRTELKKQQSATK
jgi:metallo-beta-lactamase class B